MLTHIRKVEITEAYHLKLITPLPGTLFVVVDDYIPFEVLPVSGLATVEMSDAIEDKCRIWTTKLTCTIPERFNILDRPYAFRLTDVSGKSYLLGTAELPLPVCTCKDYRPSKASEVSAVTLTVSWKSGLPMMEIKKML